ncbi:hypothetical protein EV363DRAFT_1481757, partial [Boletus edulis]
HCFCFLHSIRHPSTTILQCSESPSRNIALDGRSSCPLAVIGRHFDDALLSDLKFLMSLATQFTEDVYAAEDTFCQRSRCQAKILRGEPRHYVRLISDPSQGKYYCSACFQRVQQSPSTITLSNAPNPESIRCSVSAAQSQSTVNPPPVVAMGHSMPSPSFRRSVSATQLRGMGYLPPAVATSRSMPPPPLPPSHPASVSMPGGPDVYVPSARNVLRLPVLSTPTLLPPRSIGYGPQHAYYEVSRQHWANCARAPPAERFSLQVSAVYECGGNKKGSIRGNMIGSICEGLKGIDALSTAPDLVATALNTIVPRIQMYCPDFPWRVDEFTVRDAKWVDLSRVSPMQSYFYEDCLQQSSQKMSKGSMVFKKDKQFALFVVIPEAQWEEFENFRDKPDPLRAPSPQRRVRHRRSLQSKASTSTTRQPNPSTSVTTRTHRHQRTISASSSIDQSKQQSDPVLALRSTRTSTSTGADSQNHSLKDYHKKSDSTSSKSDSTPHSPPPKKHVTTAPFVSIDTDELRDTFVSGGSANFDVKKDWKHKYEQVEFFPIPMCSLDMLRTRPRFTFSRDDDMPGSGTSSGNDTDNNVETYGGVLRVNVAIKKLLHQ